MTTLLKSSEEKGKESNKGVAHEMVLVTMSISISILVTSTGKGIVNPATRADGAVDVPSLLRASSQHPTPQTQSRNSRLSATHFFLFFVSQQLTPTRPSRYQSWGRLQTVDVKPSVTSACRRGVEGQKWWRGREDRVGWEEIEKPGRSEV